MNANLAIFVVLLTIVTLVPHIRAGTPGTKGSPCKRWVGSGDALLTVCSDKPCMLPAPLLRTRCDGGLNCCRLAQATTTTTAAAVVTISSTAATSTTTTTTEKPPATAS